MPCFAQVAAISFSARAAGSRVATIHADGIAGGCAPGSCSVNAVQPG
jgi:hypothetical protein